MKDKKGKKSGFRIFSKDDRKKIVALIEQGDITRQQAMQQYGIADPDTLRSWILRYSTNPQSILGKVFTKAERRQAAYRIITGEVSNTTLATELSVAPSSLRQWVRNVKAETGYNKANKNLPSADEMASQSQTVEDLQLKVAALNMMIDIAEKELGIDIRKKSGTKQ
jgi:transposase-like protein